MPFSDVVKQSLGIVSGQFGEHRMRICCVKIYASWYEKSSSPYKLRTSSGVDGSGEGKHDTRRIIPIGENGVVETGAWNEKTFPEYSRITLAVKRGKFLVIMSGSDSSIVDLESRRQ